MLVKDVIQAEYISYFLPSWSPFTFNGQLKSVCTPLKWWAYTCRKLYLQALKSIEYNKEEDNT